MNTYCHVNLLIIIFITAIGQGEADDMNIHEWKMSTYCTCCIHSTLIVSPTMGAHGFDLAVGIWTVHSKGESASLSFHTIGKS